MSVRGAGREAGARPECAGMVGGGMSPHGAADFLPARRGLAALRKAASACRGCDLYAHATQTVFGEGARRARVVLVGEQPGNDADLAGTPFVGPAGRVQIGRAHV